MRGVALLVVVLLAGCTAPKAAPADDATPNEVSVEGTGGTNETVVVGARQGIVVGRVFSDAGEALPDARASLLGTDFFVDTDAEGRFRFVNVTAGRHELAVQASGFLADRRGLEVPDGGAVEVEVVLIADVGDGGSRAHVHDLWRGDATIALMDDDYALTTDDNRADYPPGYSDVYYSAYQPNQNGTVFPLILPERSDQRPPIIFPGTGELAVTFTWDSSDAQLDHLGLTYYAPGGGKRVVLGALPSGGTWTIPVNASMWDGGHAPFTAWRFNIYYGNSATGSPTTWDPAVVLGPIHVKIIAIKGPEPPLDPPHEDFWAGGNVIERTPAKPIIWGGPDTSRARPEEHLTLANGEIVPPGTTRMRLEFTYVLQSPVDAAAGKRYILTWRTADQHWYHTPLSQFATAPPTTTSQGVQVYEFPVTGGQADGYYQSDSNWDFLPARQGAQAETTEYHVGGITFNLKVTLFRDA